jgi:hypothetical protein
MHINESIQPTSNKTRKYQSTISKIKYQPTINNKLVTLKTLVSKNMNTKECNTKKLFNIYEKIDTLKLYIQKKCYIYSDPVAIQYLLHNLSANKHVNVNRLITPKQYDSNCWFNVLFVTFFISDKGRLFFHFLRHIMITGIQSDGQLLPSHLWNVFALLNLYIELCKQGNAIANKINTNKIIVNLYNIINSTNTIYNKGEAGNPLIYYNTIISYLQNTDVTLLRIRFNFDWNMSTIKFENRNNPPHIIICEFMKSINPIKRPTKFKIYGYERSKNTATL